MESNSSAKSLEGQLQSGGKEPKYLIENANRLVPWRDFSTEIRANLDTRNLASKCCVLLDIQDLDLRAIVHKIVDAFNQQMDLAETLLLKTKAGAEKGVRISYAKVSEQIFNASASGDIGPNLKYRLQNLICDEMGLLEDQSWFVLYCSLDDISKNRVAFVRLQHRTNFGPGLGDVQFIVLVIAAVQQKEIKSAFETSRTFATLFSCPQLRLQLAQTANKVQFCAAIEQSAVNLTQCTKHSTKNGPEKGDLGSSVEGDSKGWRPGMAILEDLKRRWPHYKADYWDGLCDARAIQKTISSAVFLFFAILLTAIALGVLNESNTHGKIKVEEAILGQWIGGLFFGFFGGQLFLVMLTSPPMSIYIQVMEEVSVLTGYNFYHMYAAIGIWCSIYLALFAFFELAWLMKFAKRSLVELFGCFISTALTLKAIQASVEMFRRYDPDCPNLFYNNGSLIRIEPPPPPHKTDPLNCERSVGLLFLLLMLGTVWISLSLYSFRSTPYLTKKKREFLSDYALPIAIVLMTVLANLAFSDIPKEVFTPGDRPPLPPLINGTFATPPPFLYFPNGSIDVSAPAPPPPQPPRTTTSIIAFWKMPVLGHLMCMILGFPLALLFFMDQLIVTNTVDNLQNNLKKGEAPNWDLVVVSLINVFLSVFGLLWMHGALPQAYLHLKSQADVEDRLVDGRIQEVIVKNRESRVAILLAHAMMIPTYLFLLPYLKLFPTAIFHGLFLYLAYTSAMGNEFCQRLLLLFTEQGSYPPCHYNRQVPQKTVHLFTIIELLQLVVLLLVGFAPWSIIQLTFPIVIFVFIPFRTWILPRLIDAKYLDVLDGTY